MGSRPGFPSGKHNYRPFTELKLKILFCCTVKFTGPTHASAWLIPVTPREGFQSTVTLYWPVLSGTPVPVGPPAIQSKLCAETVLSAKVRKQPLGKVVETAHRVESAVKRLVLIWTKRASYVM